MQINIDNGIPLSCRKNATFLFCFFERLKNRNSLNCEQAHQRNDIHTGLLTTVEKLIYDKTKTIRDYTRAI